VKPFVVSPNAADDLNSIWLYLATEASDEVADRTLQRLVRSFADLAETPILGHRRTDLTSLPLHFYYVRPYMVIYQRDRSPLPIHAVLHAARDVQSILRDRPT
jgi:plasmid stabilization system protein ParE